MSNVKAFLEARHHLNSPEPQRVVLGDSHRVTVPPIRLEKNGLSSTDHNIKTSPFPVRRAPAKQGFFGGKQPTSFDTDAESLEDTTTMGISARDETWPWNMNAGHRHPVNSLQSSESSGGPAQTLNEAAYAAAFSDESEGDDAQSSRGYGRLKDQFMSEEFRNFKKHNVLDKQFGQDFQYALDPAAEIGTGAPSDLGARQPPYRPTAPKFISPISHGPAPRIDRKAYLHDISIRNKAMPAGSSRRTADKKQGSAKASKDLYRTQTAKAESPSRLASRALRPSGDNTAAHASSMCTEVEATLVAERPNYKKAIHHPTSSIGHNQNDSIPDLKENETMEKVADSENAAGSLKRSRSLDHDLDQLGNMTFQQLRDESFDKVFATDIATDSPQSTVTSLKARLQDLGAITDSSSRDEEQQTFFNNLTLGQYKVSGDIIGKKLSESIAMLSSIRESKRDVAAEFESKIAKREEIIGRKAAALKVEKRTMMQRTEELAAGRSS